MNKMEGKRKAAIVAVALLAPLSFYLGQASYANNETSVVVMDKDTEACLRKLVTKRLYNRISASDEQKQKLDALFVSTADSTRALRKEVKSGVYDLSKLFASDSATDEQIKAKAMEVRSAHEKVMDERLSSLLKARKVLTGAQRQKIADRIQDALTNGRPRALGTLMDAS